jgi:DNA (cytosine-5)-methyltransferase 1
MPLTSIEICTGAGGQALGLEQAGFQHLAVVEFARHACATLRFNRPYWNTIEDDVTQWHAVRWRGRVDLFAAGVPCPPFSAAGKQLGREDERDLFPTELRLVRECRPRVVMIENVRGLMDHRFDAYRRELDQMLRQDGYEPQWRVLNASEFGVPQLRPRTILVACESDVLPFFDWPRPASAPAPTVGEALHGQMASRGWEGAAEWAERANKVAPTLVGGSTKHGGPDLGPTRARRQWEALGVNGKVIAADAPAPGFFGLPSLTVEMAATLQGFPSDWTFLGGKTHAYRQVGNAFPPPVARAVGMQIARALRRADRAAADAAAADAAEPLTSAAAAA